jgi:cytochrome c553
VLAVAAVALTLTASGVAAGPLDAPGYTKAFSCSACHGPAGNSRTASTPVLAGMPTWYFKKAIEDYAAGRRLSPEMEPFSKMVRLLGVDEVAGYFAAQPREKLAVKLDRASVANGRKAATVCAACHGDDGRGDEARGVPSLQGQPPGYLKNQMLLFKTDRRSPGDEALVKMKTVMKSLDDATMADLAAYYASLGR